MMIHLFACCLLGTYNSLSLFLFYIILLTLTQLSWAEVGLPTIMLAIIRSVQ